MPEQISIYELIVNATVLVQVVMALLALASLVSWMMIFQRWLLLRRTLNELDAFEDHFWSGVDLRELYSQLMQEDSLNSIENLFVVGFREYQVKRQNSHEAGRHRSAGQRAHLCRGQRCIAVDTPGHVHSLSGHRRSGVQW